MNHARKQLENEIKMHGRQKLFERIQQEIRRELCPDFLKSLRTKQGLTQSIERDYISKINGILQRMGLTYKTAGTQQSKDYQNIDDIGLHVEVKKTDSFKIIFNDTLPTRDIFYVILFTGKQYKTKANIEPQGVFLNGKALVEESNGWIQNYRQEIELLKDKYCRGNNKKQLQGCMEVYVRPTYSANIAHLLR